MQAFEIFKTGKHTAANGVTLEFGEDMLKEAAVAYDPSTHPAPIVVGHPRDNHPAFGWVKALDFREDGTVVAEPEQVDPEFAELVQKGRYRTRSASWYLPDSPANPKPGTLYLRHVGFLGAQPPAIKGLRDVSFAEDEGVVEFTDAQTLATLFRRLREFIINKFSAEDADRVVPGFLVEDMEQQARAPMPEPQAEPGMIKSFSEDNTVDQETKQKLDTLEAENAALKAEAAKVAEFAEKENALKARELALAKREIETEIEGLVKAGKVLPAQKAGLVEFMAQLSEGDQVVEFGEGEQAKKMNPREFMREFLGSLPKAVDFGEHSAEQKGGATDLSAAELAQKAVVYREGMAAKGMTISFTDAVLAVKSGKAN